MVLAELGGRLTAAVRAMASAPVVNEETLNEMLKEIGMLFFFQYSQNKHNKSYYHHFMPLSIIKGKYN